MEYKEWLDELMANTDIIKLISKYVPLTKKGASHWGCCPFHHEKLPSFCVNADKQLYHCFGCKAGGNAITFTKAIESVDYAEAIRILAKDANMEIPQMATNFDDGNLALRRERLFSLMREAARHYHENLKSPMAAKANEYLLKREIDDKMVRRFGLGYSIDGSEIINYLKGLGYTLEEMKDAGIAAQKADSWYDVFYSRLMYPIINNLGEVVAFGGRILENNVEFAKYRNSSQTIIFDKSRTIYAINLLKKRKQAGNFDYIIMAEGYMDVISLHKAGFDTAVASMGTALTINQAKQLHNFCEKIYISYDGDSAGQKATLRGLDILAKAGLNVKVVNLPDGLDPDDLIKQKGANAYKLLLEQASSLPAFKINALRKQFDLSKSDEKAKFAVEAVKVIQLLDNPVEKEEYLKIVQDSTGYSMPVLLKQAEVVSAQSPISEPAPVASVAPQPEVTRWTKALQLVLASMLNNRDYVDYNEDLFFLIEDNFSHMIYDFCVNRYKQGGGKRLDSLYNDFGRTGATPEDLNNLDNLSNYAFLDGDDKNNYLTCVKLLKEDALIKKKEQLVKEAEKCADMTQKIILLKQVDTIDKQIRESKENS